MEEEQMFPEGRSINGYRSRTRFMRDLTADFGPDEIQTRDEGKHKYPYIAIEQYRERVDRVIGALNYDFTYSEPQVTSIGNETVISSNGRFVIKYDDGTVCVVKSGIGTVEVKRLQSNNETFGGASNLKTAVTDAYKACCESLGIGLSQISRLKKSSSRKRAFHDEKETSVNNIDLSDTVYRVRFTGKIGNMGTKGYRIPAVTGTGEQLQVIFWKNSRAFEQLSGSTTIEKFVAAYTGRDVSIIGRRSRYRSEEEEEIRLTASALQCTSGAA